MNSAQHKLTVGGPDSPLRLKDYSVVNWPLLATTQTKLHAPMPNKTKNQRDPRRDELRRLGERVREQRRTRGLTQEALAESLDLSVAYVSLIERGGRNPPSYQTSLQAGMATPPAAFPDSLRTWVLLACGSGPRSGNS